MFPQSSSSSSYPSSLKRRRLLCVPNRNSGRRRVQTSVEGEDAEIVSVTEAYSNDCYDDIWYGKNFTHTFQAANDSYDQYQYQQHDDRYGGTDHWTETTMMTMDYGHTSTIEQEYDSQSQVVRSSWFHHLQWISSSDSVNASDEHMTHEPNSNETLEGKHDGTRNSNDMDDDDVNNNDDTHPNRNTIEDGTKMLQFMIQHLRQQLVQVKRRLQPAIERYHDHCVTAAAMGTTSSATSSSHHRTKSNTSTTTTGSHIFNAARRNCNPYEVLGEGQHHGLNQHLFMNRSAIKLVNIDAILDFTLGSPTTISAMTTARSNVFKFCDLCGAPGGFSEYILWRFQHQNRHDYNDQPPNADTSRSTSSPNYTACRGYGMSLMGHNEHGCGLPWKLQDTSQNTFVDDNQYYNGGNRYDHHHRNANTSFKICYGVNGTGDIYNWENVISLQDTIYNDDMAMAQEEGGDDQNNNDTDFGKVHLVVVDGGFDAQRNTEYQEELSLKLVVNETAAALSMLCTGGTLVIKLFGFQTSIVRSMMMHLYMTFDRIMALKPISSRPASAERYVVCYGYHGHPSYWSGQRWCNDLYLSRPCTVLNYASSDINYIEKESQLLRYLDEFDRDMYMLNLKASFAILSYIERKYLQQVALVNGGENSDGSEDIDAGIEDPFDLDDENDVDDGRIRVDIPMYRRAWRLES